MTSQPPTESAAGQDAIVLALSSEAMGRGDDDLGRMLMRSHLHVLAEGPAKPDIIVMFNTAVRLAMHGSLALDDLAALAASGVKLLLCGTCVGYFELKDQVAIGTISNMHDITEALLGAKKVISL